MRWVRSGIFDGFSLVELLITIMLIGIISAIAIPGLITAKQRGVQKRSMSDLRSIGSALEEYQIDEDMPPAGNGTADAILNQPYLVPYYIKFLPTHDGWGFDLVYQETGAFLGSGTTASYSIYSLGRWNADDLAASFGEYDNKSFHFDIYFSDGRFVCWPGQK